MTPYEFIAKWRASTLTERSASQQHFLDLCELLGEPKPADADPFGESYCFERGARKDTGGDGWADVWKRHHFAWEYKGQRADLDAAFNQLRQYALALENPPLLIVSDMQRFRIRTNWTNSVSKTYEFGLDDLTDATTRDRLKWAFSDPERLRPGETRQSLTERAAASFATVAQALRKRGHDPHEVAHFVNRLEAVPCSVEGRWRLQPDYGMGRVFKREEKPPMKKPYRIVPQASNASSRELAAWLAQDGQLLVPLVELLEKGERAIDEVIDVMGRATVEAVLQMSAEQVVGPKAQGRRGSDREVYWHGAQGGRVALKERQLRVAKPRLRKKRPRAGESGEVEIPAYTALQADRRLADRMLELVLNGVSTRRYASVLPAMADQMGISKSEVSRETIEAGTRVLQELAERDLSELEVLVVYLDGIQFGDYHVLAAVGVDARGRKHVLGLREGPSENATVTTGLLEELVERGLRADRRRLFVIDGAKALRSAIGHVFGKANLVQRCRNHKVRNVLGHLPKAQHEQARSTLRAAWKLEADEGMRKLEQYAAWVEREWPSAAASLREGLTELFTVNRLGLPQALRRCLTTTNIIDSSHAGVRQHTRRVTRWRNGEMALRWAATTFRETEKNFRRVTGYQHLWMLKAHLDDEDNALADMRKVG